MASSVTARQRDWRDVLGVGNADFYAMADLGLARRIGAALWFGGACIAAVLLPFATPDGASIGAAGWPVAAAIIAFALGYSVRLFRHPDDVGANEMLALSYVALLLVSALMWLSSPQAPYTEMLLMAALYTAAVHPPRRALPFMGAIGITLAMPLLYDAEQTVGEQLSRFLIWSGFAVAATFYTAWVRLQRADLEVAGQQARSEARIDPLTGLGNRRAYEEVLSTATVRAGRTGGALSVIVADLDSFKAINDRYGLPAGDRCLRETAMVLRESVRRPDACFRWGGDEFVVIADVDLVGAEKLAVRLAESVAGDCRRPGGEPILLHIGMAELGAEGSSPAEMLAAASLAMKPAGGDGGG